MAVKLGMKYQKTVEPELRVHLDGIFKAVRIAMGTGYQFSANVPLTEIEVCYRAYYYNGDLEEFIDLFRACERIINDRHTNKHRDKDRQPKSRDRSR